MASTSRRRLGDREIENCLNESDIEDFVPSDEDVGDPEYVPARRSPTVNSENDSDSSESEGEPFIVTSRRGRGRGRGTRRTRQGQGRSRQRGLHTGRGMGRGRARGRSTGQGRRPEEAEGESEDYSNSLPDDEPTSSGSVPASNWTVKAYNPRFPNIMEPAYMPVDSGAYDNFDYFEQYINDDLIEIMVEKSNQTAIERTGRSLNLTKEEAYVYLGITLLMSAINYPQLRMYWENKWRVAITADNMSRNRFFLLRNSFKFVFDNDISQDIKDKDKLWKVHPHIDSVQTGCHAQVKEQYMSIDEMIIPFSGFCSMKQYCPGKPNPVGLKAFVLANPDGLVCGFDVYQGQSAYPNYDDSSFGLAEKAVLNLADGLVPGHVLYFDRYFTSEKLVDALESRGIRGTGTLMKNRIPADIRDILMDDKELKSQGRGSFQVVVRNDENLAVTKWFDSKGVVFMSSAEGDVEVDECRRWCKKTKSYIHISRPRVVKQYNQKMGGVDMADRLLAVCPYRCRTVKWTQRFFSHMVDLGVTNSWLQFRRDQLKARVPLKKIPQLRSFKMGLGETLVETYNLTNSNVINENEDHDDEQVEASRKRRGKPTNPLPSKKFRTHGTIHMPEFVDNANRCRGCHYNRTHFKCRACDVSLCLTRNRNCFVDFHQDD